MFICDPSQTEIGYLDCSIPGWNGEAFGSNHIAFLIPEAYYVPSGLARDTVAAD